MPKTEKGLSSAEVLKRQTSGKNILPEGKKKSIFGIFMQQFASPLIILLAIAAVISFFAGESVDGAVIAIVVIANVVIGAMQEISANKSVEKLREITTSSATVIRDGEVQQIPSTELVVGDYVLLEAGAVVPADMKLLVSSSLKINESALTGESVASEKDAGTPHAENAPLAEQTDCAFMSTLVEYGRGEGVVTSIGENTEIGKISRMLRNVTKKETPLQQNLNRVSMVLGFAGILLCLAMFAFQIGNGGSWLDVLMVSIAFAVAVIPEGLATVVTLVLTSGIKKMNKQNAIVKQIHSVETLGAVNVICTDKTGTLTQNRMTVVKWVYDGKTVEAGEENQVNPDFLSLLTGFCACNDASYDIKTKKSVGDPTEAAFVMYQAENEIPLQIPERISELPFDSDRKMMTTLHKGGAAYTKGAVDSLLPRCTHILDGGIEREITASDITGILKESEKMSTSALRVLALAGRKDGILKEENLTFIGLAGMIDPPKESVAETIAECHHAGIDVVMITGDHKTTAFAIARSLGIASEEAQCISGPEMDAMTEPEFSANAIKYRVFSRVSPEHKAKIVAAFQSHGKIVSMTGDGVNDSPSLKSADIGVAMGSGTEVAKDAADMILVDDNFITIKNAVMEGRNLFNNIKKAVLYLLRANFGEVVLMASAIFGGIASPLSTIQILWVNLFTDTMPSLALGMDKSTPKVMNEKPRDVKKGLLGKRDYLSIFIQGVVCAIPSLAAFLLPALASGGIDSLRSSMSDLTVLSLCRTQCFAVLTITEVLMAYVSKTKAGFPFFTKESWNNPVLNISSVAVLLLQIFALRSNVMVKILGITRCTFREILLLFGISLVGVLINACISKAFDAISMEKGKN